MILLAHMLLGAVVGYQIENIPLAIVLAFLCHYFLDLFPHVEYSINNLHDKKWKKSLPDMAKVFLDFILGLGIIFLVSKNQPLIYIGALIAIVPDGLTLISYAFPNKVMAAHDYIHTKKIHYFKYKKISNFWRILTQVISVSICILVLLR
ncbi:MAG: hypothetical protein A3D44_01270 [Candidatus Staskawiczbacteria bacterium RIFCSPHIGHO2_02_FULL_42_22]|uniref:DUF3307 domain-containing protein n=1 Tax=Candidatus Staskawiczbacteria bacterium RIFCSPHIGHO2_02_FULL_42_22 TaxID=1802207 RepID=A0A1G2I180_9BACT|nr:MAG: hypothetical protein A3D44_01270 [Candidatus Staskawiczbacteria bacterium RIFCSPHIGHO2_02_FULL_42_22]